MTQKVLVVAIGLFLIVLTAIGAATSNDVYGKATDGEKCYGLGLGHRNHDEEEKNGNGHHKPRCEREGDGGAERESDDDEGGDDEDG